MSGLVDMWTTELAKLRQKGRDYYFTPAEEAVIDTVTSAPVVKDGGFLAQWPVRVGNIHCSDASVTMLVHIFSP